MTESTSSDVNAPIARSRGVVWGAVISMAVSVLFITSMRNFVGYPDSDFPFLGYWALTVVSLAALVLFTVLWMLDWSGADADDSDSPFVMPWLAIAAIIASFPLLLWQIVAAGRSVGVTVLSCAGLGLLALVITERVTAQFGLRLALRVVAGSVCAVAAAMAILPPHIQVAKRLEWLAADDAYSAVSLGSNSVSWARGETPGTVAILSVEDGVSLSPAWHHLPGSMRASRPSEAQYVALVRTVKEPIGSLEVDGWDTPLYRRNLKITFLRGGETQPVGELTLRGETMNLGYTRTLVRERGGIAVSGFPGSRVEIEGGRPREVLTAPRTHQTVAAEVQRLIEGL